MNDKFTVRAVVVILGVFALVGLVLTGWLVHDNRPAASIAVISGAMGSALGALSALLASVRVLDANTPTVTVGASTASVGRSGVNPYVPPPTTTGDAAQ